MPQVYAELSGEVIFESTSYEYGIIMLMQQNTLVHDITINRISFNKFKRNGIFISGYSTSGRLNEVEVSDCKFGPLDENTAIPGGINCAAVVSQKAQNITINRCRIDYNGNRNAQTDGLYFDRSDNVEINNNYIFVKNDYPGSFHIDCIQFAEAGGRCTTLTIQNNNIIQRGLDRDFACINMTGIDGVVKIINNNILSDYCKLLINIHFYSTTTGLKIYNNTLVGKGDPPSIVTLIKESGSTNNLEIKNNIFYKEDDNNGYVLLVFEKIDDYEITDDHLDFNLYWNTSGIKGQLDFDNTDFINWDSGAWESNGLGKDPLFQNMNPNDYLYTLNYSSPAKNKGLKIDDVQTDILGHKRPYWVEKSFDIGAYEIPDAQFKIGVTGVDNELEVFHTITPIGKNWERAPAGNWQMTNSTALSTHPTTGNSVLNSLNTWEGWSFDWLNQGTTDPNQKFRLGFYKLSIHIPPPISLDDYIYLDCRDGAYSTFYEPEIHIYYDKEQHTYKINQNGVWINKISGDIVRVWDLKGQTSNTNLLPYYWANALIPIISKDDHPLIVWGPHPNPQGTYIVWRKYRDFNFVPLPSTQLLQYEDPSVIVQQGEDPESFLVKYKVVNSLSQETNIVEYTVVSIFEKMFSDRADLVFQLYQNYPNPFNPQTTISFTVPEDSKVNLVVYDILGKEVVTLINDNLNAGIYDVEFNAKNLASGIYFYRLSAGKNYETKKLQLIK